MLNSSNEETTGAETLNPKLLEFERLLLEANRSLNLVSRDSAERFRERHLLPCLRFARHPDIPEHGTLIDVGSGGGLPGMVIAIEHPELEVHLVEARRKKSLFLEATAVVLELSNVRVHWKRVEDLRPVTPVDAISIRFLGGISKIEEVTRGIRQPGSRLFLFKGRNEKLPDRIRDLVLERREALIDDKDLAIYKARDC